MNPADTIMAVSSPPGRGQRALLRLSGPAAIRITGTEGLARGCHLGRPGIEGPVPPMLLLIAPGPSSYTGDDLVEMLLPGGPAILEHLRNRLLDRARRHDLDLRQAGPGEFTARAYLNGRIDLLEAEGIAEAIRAESESHLRAARLMSDGSLGTFARDLADSLTRLTAMVEAGIDFTDQEDVVAIADDDLEASLVALSTELERRLDRTTSIERIESVPRVVLAGPANAGKSSLFNALLGRARTVVAPIAGTTRDVITESMVLAGPAGDLEILLSDLAGFEPTIAAGGNAEESVRASMQGMARQAVSDADLVVRCTPPDGFPSALPPGTAFLDVTTKADLAERPLRGLSVSVLEGTGIDRLRDLVADRLGSGSNVLGSGMLALTRRHRDSLDRSTIAIGNALGLLRTEGVAPPVELVAASLRDALDALGELVGRITPDEVLEHVFASFCVGK